MAQCYAYTKTLQGLSIIREFYHNKKGGGVNKKSQMSKMGKYKIKKVSSSICLRFDKKPCDKKPFDKKLWPQNEIGM